MNSEEVESYVTFISEIKIENFRSIRDASIECKPLNLYIGENGTGKSSVLDVIGFILQSDTSLRITGNLADWGTMSRVVHNKDIQNEIFIQFAFNNPCFFYTESRRIYPIDKDLYYQIRVKPIQLFDRETQYRFTIEGKFRSKEGTKNDDANLQWVNNCTLIGDQKVKDIEVVSVNSEVYSYLTNVANIIGSEDFKDYHIKLPSRGSWRGFWGGSINVNMEGILERKEDKLIFDLRTYRPRCHLIPANRLFTQWSYSFHENPPDYIRLNDGGNSIAQFFLYYPKEEYEHHWNRIQKWLKEFNLDNFRVILNPGRKILMELKDTQADSMIEIKAVGSGMNQIMGLIISCVLAKKGEILLIEEPEIHLHPKYQAKVMNLIIETVGRGVQVFITTHSEYLLLRLQRKIAEGDFTSENVSIYEFERIEGESRTKEIKLDEKGYFAKGLPTFLEHSKEEFNAIEKFLNE